jgi:hypothetical protein
MITKFDIKIKWNQITRGEIVKKKNNKNELKTQNK